MVSDTRSNRGYKTRKKTNKERNNLIKSESLSPVYSNNVQEQHRHEQLIQSRPQHIEEQICLSIDQDDDNNSFDKSSNFHIVGQSKSVLPTKVDGLSQVSATTMQVQTKLSVGNRINIWDNIAKNYVSATILRLPMSEYDDEEDDMEDDYMNTKTRMNTISSSLLSSKSPITIIGHCVLYDHNQHEEWVDLSTVSYEIIPSVAAAVSVTKDACSDDSCRKYVSNGTNYLASKQIENKHGEMVISNTVHQKNFVDVTEDNDSGSLKMINRKHHTFVPISSNNMKANPQDDEAYIGEEEEEEIYFDSVYGPIVTEPLNDKPNQSNTLNSINDFDNKHNYDTDESDDDEIRVIEITRKKAPTETKTLPKLFAVKQSPIERLSSLASKPDRPPLTKQTRSKTKQQVNKQFEKTRNGRKTRSKDILDVSTHPNMETAKQALPESQRRVSRKSTKNQEIKERVELIDLLQIDATGKDPCTSKNDCIVANRPSSNDKCVCDELEVTIESRPQQQELLDIEPNGYSNLTNVTIAEQTKQLSKGVDIEWLSPSQNKTKDSKEYISGTIVMKHIDIPWAYVSCVEKFTENNDKQTIDPTVYKMDVSDKATQFFQLTRTSSSPYRQNIDDDRRGILLETVELTEAIHSSLATVEESNNLTFSAANDSAQNIEASESTNFNAQCWSIQTKLNDSPYMQSTSNYKKIESCHPTTPFVVDSTITMEGSNLSEKHQIVESYVTEKKDKESCLGTSNDSGETSIVSDDDNKTLQSSQIQVELLRENGTGANDETKHDIEPSIDITITSNPDIQDPNMATIKSKTQEIIQQSHISLPSHENQNHESAAFDHTASISPTRKRKTCVNDSPFSSSRRRSTRLSSTTRSYPDVGSRIEVWRSDVDRPSYCPGTIMKTKVTNSRTEYFVQYDDESNNKAWVDLDKVFFPPPSTKANKSSVDKKTQESAPVSLSIVDSTCFGQNDHPTNDKDKKESVSKNGPDPDDLGDTVSKSNPLETNVVPKGKRKKGVKSVHPKNQSKPQKKQKTFNNVADHAPTLVETLKPNDDVACDKHTTDATLANDANTCIDAELEIGDSENTKVNDMVDQVDSLKLDSTLNDCNDQIDLSNDESQITSEHSHPQEIGCTTNDSDAALEPVQNDAKSMDENQIVSINTQLEQGAKTLSQDSRGNEVNENSMVMGTETTEFAFVTNDDISNTSKVIVFSEFGNDDNAIDETTAYVEDETVEPTNVITKDISSDLNNEISSNVNKEISSELHKEVRSDLNNEVEKADGQLLSEKTTRICLLVEESSAREESSNVIKEIQTKDSTEHSNELNSSIDDEITCCLSVNQQQPQPQQQQPLHGNCDDTVDVDKTDDKRLEPCAICNSNTMKRPRATQCYHLFCEPCIQLHHQTNNKSCPICHESLGEQLILFAAENKTHENAFLPVEMVDIKTWAIVSEFASASSASRVLLDNDDTNDDDSSNVSSARMILKCCLSKKVTNREYCNYYWQFAGSYDLVIRPDFIQQVEHESGLIIRTFASINHASKRTGIDPEEIRRGLQDHNNKQQIGKIINSAGSDERSYYWRYVSDSNNIPAVPDLHGPTPTTSSIKPQGIEQICLRTGDVIRTYDSFASAKRAFQCTDNWIREVVIGARDDAYGYFWRMEGSDTLPWTLADKVRCIQIHKFRGTNEYVREFMDHTSASYATGIGTDRIRHLCKHSCTAFGYKWSYSHAKDPVPVIDEVVDAGKTLLIEKPRERTWVEGRISYYDSPSEKHCIVLEGGDVALVNLKNANYLWKIEEHQENHHRHNSTMMKNVTPRIVEGGMVHVRDIISEADDMSSIHSCSQQQQHQHPYYYYHHHQQNNHRHQDVTEKDRIGFTNHSSLDKRRQYEATPYVSRKLQGKQLPRCTTGLGHPQSGGLENKMLG